MLFCSCNVDYATATPQNGSYVCFEYKVQQDYYYYYYYYYYYLNYVLMTYLRFHTKWG